MPVLPTGMVTFLFTDIEGSTTLLQRLGDRRLRTSRRCCSRTSACGAAVGDTSPASS